MAETMPRKSQPGIVPPTWAISSTTRADVMRMFTRALSAISACLRAVTESMSATPSMAMPRAPQSNQRTFAGAGSPRSKTAAFFIATPAAVMPSCVGMWAKSQSTEANRVGLSREPATSSK